LTKSNDPVIDWLLDADPSIRWQVMRDLTDTPAEIECWTGTHVGPDRFRRGIHPLLWTFT
jgi:hypothetical protein